MIIDLSSYKSIQGCRIEYQQNIPPDIGFVDWAGSYVEYEVTVDAGTYVLNIGLGSPNTQPTELDAYVNGALAAKYAVPYFNNWQTGKVVSNQIQLQTGTNRIRLQNVPGSGYNIYSLSLDKPHTNFIDPNYDPSSSILVCYNLNSNDGKILKDYYLANRPGFQNANILGLDVPEQETVDMALFYNRMLNPLLSWMYANPQKQIKAIVMLRGLPTRTQWGVFGSVHYKLSREASLGYPPDPSKPALKGGKEYWNNTDLTGYPAYNQDFLKYSPNTHPGTWALFSQLDMGSVDATKAYIDKLSQMFKAMTNPSLMISASNAGLGGTTYVFDNNTYLHQNYSWVNPPKEARDAVLSENPQAKINYYDNVNPDQVAKQIDVTGLTSFGASYGGIGSSVGQFSGKSNWWIIQSIESFNGIPTSTQDNFYHWFAPNAFGGTNYSSTPVGAVCHVEEPYATGVNSAAYFRYWERGFSFIECAWASRRTPFFMAVGDPWIRK